MAKMIFFPPKYMTCEVLSFLEDWPMVVRVVPQGRRHFNRRQTKIIDIFVHNKWDRCLWVCHNQLTNLPIWDSLGLVISCLKIHKSLYWSYLLKFSPFCFSPLSAFIQMNLSWRCNCPLQMDLYLKNNFHYLLNPEFFVMLILLCLVVVSSHRGFWFRQIIMIMSGH